MHFLFYEIAKHYRKHRKNVILCRKESRNETEMQEQGGTAMQLLTFMLGEVKYGIPIEHVQSIEERVQVVGIPKTLPCVKGIMNLHGNIIPIYSLAEKFGYRRENIQNIVVVDVNGMAIGFEVAKVDEILEVGNDHVQPMPQMISNSEKFMTNVADYDKKLIVLLNVDELLETDEQNNIKELLKEEKTPA